MTSVWVLTSGSYSDLTVDAVFSSLEELEKVTKCFPDGDWNEPQEFVLDELVSTTEKGYFRFLIYREKNGYQRVIKMRPDDGGNSISLSDSPYCNYISCSISADTEERALKVMSEKLAMMKAEDMKELRW